MYEFVSRVFGHQAGVVTAAIWIALLILLILMFGGTPETTLRYLNM